MPGAGDKAAFESPKVAAHGDLACTAAMQLAKPLKQNPRQVAENLRSALMETQRLSALGRGDRHRRPRLSSTSRLKAAAKQQVVAEVLAAGEGFGAAAANGRQVMVEFVSANPTGPAARRPRPAGRAGRRDLQPVRDPGLATSSASSITTMPACRSPRSPPRVQCAPRASSPATAAGPRPPTTATTSPTSPRDFLARQDRDAPTTASSPRRGDVDDLDGIRQFAVAYLRHEQDLDLQAFGVRFDNYYLESSLYTERQGRRDGARGCVDAGKTYEQDGALWLRSHRLRRRQGPRHAQVRRHATPTSCPTSPTTSPSGSAASPKAVNIQGTDHHGTIARVRAGLQAAGVGIPQGYPDYVLHTMVRVMRGGEEVKISKRAGSYVTLRDLIEWTSRDAVRFFLLSRKPDTEYVFDIDLALAQNNDNPVYYVQYAHARICSVLAAWGGDAAELRKAPTCPLLESAAGAGADAATGASIPRC